MSLLILSGEFNNIANVKEKIMVVSYQGSNPEPLGFPYVQPTALLELYFRDETIVFLRTVIGILLEVLQTRGKKV